MSFLSFENLVVGYSHKKPLIYPCSAKITEAGIYAIFGQNGTGKSTLLKTWIGLIKPLSGSIYINDILINTKRHINYGIAYVPQSHVVNSYFHISVGDFVKHGFGPDYKENNSDNSLINDFLKKWQLAGYENKSFHELSGGQKTRAMIVRAIISQPKILFLDEPLSSLDSCCQLLLMNTLAEMVQKNVCVFMIDHHFENFTSYITKKITFYRKHDDEQASVEF